MAARRGRPKEAGLDYFPKMVNFYEDDKIFDLLDQYGPLGVTVYDCILSIVYSQGYYAEIPKDKLSKMIIKKIGNKWIKNQKAVVQVIDFCADLGLIEKDLLVRGVITSVGIQKRFYRIAVKLMKRQLYSDEYWLLEDENTENISPGFKSAPSGRIISEENRIVSEENTIDSEESSTERKENKRKEYIYTASPESHRYFEDKALNDAFVLYVKCRLENGDKLNQQQVVLLKEQLEGLSSDTAERLAIVKRATMGGEKGCWKSFFPVTRKRPSSGRSAKSDGGHSSRNRFKNFEERTYDMDALEKALIEKNQREINRNVQDSSSERNPDQKSNL